MSVHAAQACRPILWLLLTGVLLATGGCVTHPDGPHGLACPPIEAAITISFSNERSQAFQRIAARRELNQHEQTYLANAIVQTGGVADDQANALVALVRNPCCTDETRAQIARQLKWVGLSDARRRVAEALADYRAPVTTAPG
jgi:hypothetical protein